jgi:hypothetical protein
VVAVGAKIVMVTGREFEKLARRHLLAHLPGFALKGGHLYALPVDRFWRRFDLYASGFGREAFTIYCSVSPLYVPETMHAYPFGLGDRLPVLAGQGDRWWEWRPGNENVEQAMMESVLALMQAVGVPLLMQLATPEAVAERLAQQPSLHDDCHTVEALAYSLILCGQTASAKESLAHLKRITLDDEARAEWWAENQKGIRGQPREDWVIEVGKRGEAVANALRRSAADAIVMLDRWNEEQLVRLRLKRYA